MVKESFSQTNKRILIGKVAKPSCIHYNDIFEHLLNHDLVKTEPRRAAIDCVNSGFGTSIIPEERFGTMEISRMMQGKMSRFTIIKYLGELEDSGHIWSRPNKGIPPLAYYILHKQFIPSELCATAEFQRSLLSDGFNAVTKMITKQCPICSKEINPLLEFLTVEKLHFPPERWFNNEAPHLEMYISRVKITWECLPHLMHYVLSINCVSHSEVKRIKEAAEEYHKSFEPS